MGEPNSKSPEFKSLLDQRSQVVAKPVAKKDACFALSQDPRAEFHLCALQHFVTKIGAQIARGAQVNAPSAQERRQLKFDLRQAKQAGRLPWLKLDQEIHVALGPLAAFEHRAEQGQPPDVIAPTDLGELVAIEAQVSRHAVLSQKRGCAGPLMAANRAARPGEQSHGRTMPSYSDF